MSYSSNQKKQRTQFVGLLWKIKRRFSEIDNSHINLSMLINSAEYRNDVLQKALKSNDGELRSLTERVLAFDSGDSLPSRQVTQPIQPPSTRPQLRSAFFLVFAGMLLALAIGTLGFFMGQQEDQATNDKGTASPAGTQTAPAESPSAPTTAIPPPAEAQTAPAESLPAPATTIPPPAEAQTAPAPAESLPAPTMGIPPPAAQVAAIAPVAPVSRPSLLPDPNPRTVLRIHGSNTVGAALSPALVEGYLKSIGATDTLIVSNDAAPNELSVQAILPEETGVIAVEIQAHGSGTAFKGLAARSADMGQSSRPIKGEEVKQLEPTHGHMTGQASEHVIGLDGLAVVVHPSNPIDQLTTDQLAALFSGQTTDWSEIGGKLGAVNVYTRDDKSGTFDSFKHLVLKRHNVKLTEKSRRYESNARLSDDVSVDPFGIGFCGLPYVRNSKLLAIADSSDSLAQIPTSFTVGTEDYPLARRLFFYTPANTHNKHILGLTEFTLSEPGQEIVREVGFISQNIYGEKPVPPVDAPDEYKELTNNAERLSLNFRFKTGMSELDNKSVRDLRRLVDFMDKHKNRAHQLMLFGFTDNTGGSSRNLELSVQRARVVEQFLTARGLSPTVVKGYGMILPVASNATQFGRNKNRRVEVWLK